ncbi:OLC1v1021317C1 [Oldenlandia corymbosa var. corymbosa]|uniref:OLC1v1021317C1 n=1 Tax=Oldenlandia corymbosa var. corymbosa TaxID=529605 RepID=A0AAV1BVD6_OLDCO|nr:OLC1v1021317C1 [Oldenlandia corymbosa var. corymbosa]
MRYEVQTDCVKPTKHMFISLLVATQSVVPANETFKYVNQGDFGFFINEYDASYRAIPIATHPFQFAFYNTTPNAYILGLRMAVAFSESVRRWVWDANRGKPVKENATLTFGRDGNLVLADADGKVAWQTGTANKGVVGLELLENGNLVLYDSKKKFVWQSFDYPTDTLLVGQALKAPRSTRLVSRLSVAQPVNGPYSFVMEKQNWAMYYQSPNSQKPLVYSRSKEFGNGNGTLASLEFFSTPENDWNHAFNTGLQSTMPGSQGGGSDTLTRPKYNTTYSFLRVDIDGNLRIYTYDDIVDNQAWEITFVLFDRDEGRASECNLPRRCGSLGVCEDDQCVACPKQQGLLGWSKTCAPPALLPCKAGSMVDYYKVDGVEHYTSEFNPGSGPMSLAQCKVVCTKDCKCLGFFYQRKTSKCLLVPVLGTLVKVPNSTYTGYIKISK